MKLPDISLRSDEVLVLRCVKSDMSAYGGFIWPANGAVTCPDWRPTKECGNGFHGWLKGVGNYQCWSGSESDKWLVLAVLESSIIDLGDKVKFPAARVLFCGPREVASGLLIAHCPGCAVIFGTATAGYRGTATAGHSGTATAGDSGTAMAGDSGTAKAGYRGTATAGDSGTATAGDSGTATAGDAGVISIKYYDLQVGRHKVVIGYIGEGGLIAGKKYRLNKKSQFEQVPE